MAVYTAVDDSEAHFQAVIYTGDGAANEAITLPGETDMQPDLVWIKNRDQADSHCLFDAVRGATKMLNPDTDTAEVTDTDTLDSFASDGFQVDADDKVNTNTEDYVAWCWKANGTGSSNTDGSINTAATSANTTAGFSISTLDGTGSNATVGHGLSSAPTVVLLKDLDGTNAWMMYHVGAASDAETDFFLWARPDAPSDNATFMQDTAPTGTVFSMGTLGDINTDGQGIVAYCFQPVQGFSKFGSYTGTANVAPLFVWCGFKPAFVLVKNASRAQSWEILDNKRDPYNPATHIVQVDQANAEHTGNDFDADFLSNGFAVRSPSTSNANYASGNRMIFMAFAEAPFVNSNGVPCNAR